MRIVILGSGNLATNLSYLLLKKGFEIVQVYSHTLENAKILADLLGCDYTATIENITNDCDIYISAIKDNISEYVWKQINFNDKLVLHTSGSLPMSILENVTKNYGVLYPLMTLSKSKLQERDDIPFFIEANSQHNLHIINEIAEKITTAVYNVDSKKRMNLHYAAVWANNFTNCMYSVAKDITDRNNLPFEVLLPIIDETAEKIHRLTPREAQTGPAVRFDENIITKHLSLSSNEQERILYKMISDTIHEIAQRKS